jgi:hypothetical protein
MTSYKTHDYIYCYHGCWRPGGICRIEIFEHEGAPPTIVCTELSDNDNSSITVMAECNAQARVSLGQAHWTRIDLATVEELIGMRRDKSTQDKQPGLARLDLQRSSVPARSRSARNRRLAAATRDLPAD